MISEVEYSSLYQQTVIAYLRAFSSYSKAEAFYVSYFHHKDLTLSFFLLLGEQGNFNTFLFIMSP